MSSYNSKEAIFRCLQWTQQGASGVQFGHADHTLTCVTFDEFVVFHGSRHSGEAPHGLVKLLHFLRVASLQHWKQEMGQTKTIRTGENVK